jgi:CheY-like chemotaxis protein
VGGNVSESPKQYQVLFVDDDHAFLEVIRDLFVAWSENVWQVHCAESADEALAVLNTHKIDLIVVDVNMPVLDGIQLIRILNRRYPQLKKAVITGFATEEKRSACLTEGAELFIEKPHSAEGLKSVFTMLHELISWIPQKGFQGVLRQVGLYDVLQMECLGRNSSILEIHNKQMHGRIYIEEGKIVHATAGDMVGQDAFQKLLSLPSGKFQMQPFEPPPAHSIEGQWESLLMEAARLHDETASQALTTKTAEKPEPLPAAKTSASIAVSGFPVRIAETLICSGQGDVLYAWQCPDVNARVMLLQHIAQQTTRLGELLPLGSFDRLEIQLGTGRVVAQVKPDRMILVHAASGDDKTELKKA